MEIGEVVAPQPGRSLGLVVDHTARDARRTQRFGQEPPPNHEALLGETKTFVGVEESGGQACDPMIGDD